MTRTRTIGIRNVVEIYSDHVLKIGEKSESARPRRLFVEKFALERLRKYGLAVPKILSYGALVDGREYTKLELIKGERGSSRKLQRNLFNIYKNVGAQFRKMPMGFKKFGWINPQTLNGEFSSWDSYLASFVKKYGMQLYKRGLLNKSGMTILLKCIENLRGKVKRACFVHRDLKPNNLIVNSRVKKVYVTDWENVILGDPLFDLAVLEANFKNPKILKGFVAGILNRQLSKKEKERISLYLIIAKIGIIDFNLKNKLPLHTAKDLNKQIQRLGSPSKKTS